MKKLFFLVIISLIGIFSGCYFEPKEQPITITSVVDIVNFFPKTSTAMKQLSANTEKKVQEIVKTIVATPQENYSFDTIFSKLDDAIAIISGTISLFEVIFMLNPDQNLRNTAENESIRLKQVFIDLIAQNKDLYNKLAQYAQTKAPQEPLTDEQNYFIKEIVESYKRDGVDLPDEKHQKVKELQKKLADLTMLFEKNINDDTSTILVTRDELQGLDDEFIATLKKTSEGLYSIGVDYPTYFKVMKEAENAQTRKKLFETFYNRAYPANEEVLNNLIATRNELAHLLNFPSFAHLDIDGQMAKTPETVEKFLSDLVNKSAAKATKEFTMLTKELPPSIELTPDGKLYPWDIEYLSNWYIKKNYDINPYKIAEYFPMEKTIEGLFIIYQQFFGITLKEIPLNGLWDNELKLLEVHKGNTLQGYIILDLYPRDNKYKHACNLTIIPVLRTQEGIITPGLTVVIANFPKSTATKPSLLLRTDVSTFFHEFGHALHALLGATVLKSQSGTQVKTDFVELPSQLLEEWLFDKDILYDLSNHYKTGEKMPREMIDKIVALKNLTSGRWLIKQIIYSYLALRYFGPGKEKDMQEILKNLQETFDKYIEYDQNNHLQTSFDHLTNYASKYYSYLWSKVFALDLFATIKKYGLLNPEIGKKYVDTILSKGGSKDPEELLEDFLGRKPNADAFFRDLGL